MTTINQFWLTSSDNNPAPKIYLRTHIYMNLHQPQTSVENIGDKVIGQPLLVHPLDHQGRIITLIEKTGDKVVDRE